MEFRKKMTAILLIAIFMISTLVIAVNAEPSIVDTELQSQDYYPGGTVVGSGIAGYAPDPENTRGDVVRLFASKLGNADATGAEGRVRINLVDTTLADIISISWDEYLVEGYAPHVDLIIPNDKLNFEYTYNDLPGHDFKTGLLGVWYETFSDDGNGPSAITGTSMAWLDSGPAGSPGDDEFIYYSLDQWKNGVYAGIDDTTPVYAIEIEVDDWVANTEAYVDNIVINGELVTDITVDVVSSADVVAISIDKTDVYFGLLGPGDISEPKVVTVTNIGNVDVTVTTSLIGPDAVWYDDNMVIVLPPSIGPALTGSVTLTLEIPEYNPVGTYSATLVFWATPVAP